jgi:hypothetical protein
MKQNRVFLDLCLSYTSVKTIHEITRIGICLFPDSCDFVDRLLGWQISQSTTLPMLEFT